MRIYTEQVLNQTPLKSICTLLILLVTVGCGPSLEGEQKAYDRHRDRSNEYAERYPGLKPMLESQIEKAEDSWEAATAETDEKKKLAAMQTVNKSFQPLVGRIDQIETELSSMDRQLRKLERTSRNLLTIGSRKNLRKRYEQLADQVDAELRKARPKNDAEAMTLVSTQYATLNPLSSEINRAVSRAERERRKKRK